MARNKIALIGRECVACGACVGACSVGAISIYKGLYAMIAEALCVGCGKCEARCPAGVIEMAARRETRNAQNALV